MGEFIFGKLELKILEVYQQGRISDRYVAEVTGLINKPNDGITINLGDKVRVKFNNNGEQPENYLGKVAVFDGKKNDIQTNLEKVKINRSGFRGDNPFITENNDTAHKIEEPRMNTLIKECIKLLEENHNLILTGAPGTGKTFLAIEIAKEIIDATEEEHKNQKYWEFVQFHPSYDYTDFVEGLRPSKKDDSSNSIGFELKNGIFKDFCKKALNDDSNYVFIIDEINRGEISKIFGELFFSIDPGYRGKKGKVKTQYANMQSGKTIFDDSIDSQGWFYVPRNVYIIGTMNDIDRSVESFDFAMRRRFVWKEVKAEDSAKTMGLLTPTIERMNRLNNALSSEDGEIKLSSSYHIGASYFRKADDNDENKVIEPNYNDLWELRLEPLLREYIRGIPDIETKIKKLKEIYDGFPATKNTEKE